ncbi:MAG: response regulator [Cyclobacteriaceae bacterium]|nr:response regulator [Cyclobacteriaceae bacterium]
MHKYIIILLLGWLSISPLFSQRSHELDSLKEQFNKVSITDDRTRITLLNNLSFMNQGYDYRQALQYGREALRLSEQINFKEGIAMAKNRMANCYWILGDNELAIEYALSAASIAEENKLISLQADAYRLLGATYTGRREFDKAEYYINEAEKKCLQIGNEELLMKVYNASGLILSFKKNNDSSILILNEALRLAVKNHKSFYIPIIYGNLGQVHAKLSTSDASEVAAKFYKTSLILARQEQNHYAEVVALNHMGSTTMAHGQFKESQEYLTEALALSERIGFKSHKLIIYMNFIGLKMKQKDFWGAHEYMSHYYSLKDTLLNEKKTRRVVELEMLHETEKREATIKLLEQEKRIQSIWANVFVVGIILSIGVGLIIYRLQKLRTRKTKELLETQKKLNAKLKETDVLKSRFFANISHEFRTPLTLIKGPIEEKLNSPRLSGSDREIFSVVRRNTNRLLDLVNQLLDLSKLEAGKMELQLKSDNLHEFIQLLVTSFDSLAEHKKITFIRNINIADKPARFDSDKLEKIIGNVLFNAFKFTPAEGRVELTIQSSDQNKLNILISDTGRGIPEDEIPYVFTPFYQIKNTQDDGQPGTGLGLSLVNELVKLHNGTINLKSRVNEGTEININLIIDWNGAEADESSEIAFNNIGDRISRYEDAPELETIFENQLSDNTILIVEDNAELRNFIARIFKNRFTVLMAEHGEQGIALALEHIPDLIISDVMMPKMSGLELTEKIKLDERTSHIPVILLTAKADDESRMQGFKIGADDYLSKPFSAEELKIRVNNLIELRKKLIIKFRDGLVPFSEPLPKEIAEPTLDEKFIARAREVVERNITDSSFGVEKFAEEMNLSRAQLFRKLKVLVDSSPTDFISDIRLLRAAELIRSKTDTISQISYKVGFNEQSYFAKRFRKKFGVSPSEYVNG